MAKGGKGYSGKSSGFSFGKSSSSTSSYRIAPPPTPKIHNNIFSTKKMEVSTVPSTPVSSTKSSSTVSSPIVSSSPTVSSSSSGGFLSNMMDGFSFGTGSSIARNMVDRIFAPPLSSSSGSIISNGTISNKDCNELEKSWNECMNLHNQDMNICKKAFEDYEACKKNM